MCDTWVALLNVTATERVIFAKNSDRPIFDCQPLVRYPRQDWLSGSRAQLEYVSVPQPETTFATLGSSPYWCWGYEEGINEHGVVIGNEAIYTRTFRQATENPPEPGLLGMDLIRLGLERGETAALAVQVMGDLIEEYGQYGSGVPGQDHASGGYDNSFIVADRKEAWVLEAVGKRWVARRETAGYYSISNEPTIRHEWDVGSADVEDYARAQGWWPAHMPFDFARAYIDDQTPRQVSHLRVMRSRQLLAERAGGITPGWMMRIARDHYEDTFLDGPFFDAADPDFQSICMHVSTAGFTWGNTVTSCVAELDEVPVFWWTPGPPCNGCYVPFFVHGSQLPEIVTRVGSFGKRVTPPPDVEPDSALPHSYWWFFRILNDYVKGEAIRTLPGLYPTRNRILREQFDPLEREFAAQVPEVVQAAKRADGIDAAVLDEFTAACVKRAMKAATRLVVRFNN